MSETGLMIVMLMALIVLSITSAGYRRMWSKRLSKVQELRKRLDEARQQIADYQECDESHYGDCPRCNNT